MSWDCAGKGFTGGHWNHHSEHYLRKYCHKISDQGQGTASFVSVHINCLFGAEEAYISIFVEHMRRSSRATQSLEEHMANLRRHTKSMHEQQNDRSMLEMNSQSWVEFLKIILDTDCTARDLRIPESQHESSQGYLSRPECEGTVWSTLAQHWHTTPRFGPRNGATMRTRYARFPPPSSMQI